MMLKCQFHSLQTQKEVQIFAQWLSLTDKLYCRLSLPTPAAARYNAHGHPSPPIPTIRTLPFLSFACPKEI